MNPERRQGCSISMTLVFNKMLTGIIVFDSDFRIEQLNERASLLLGPSDSQKLLARHDSLDQVPNCCPITMIGKPIHSGSCRPFCAKTPIFHCKLALVKFAVTVL